MSRRPQQGGMFGAQRARTYHPNVKPAGYAAKPGTGPDGETCSTCEHCRFRQGRKRKFYKCSLMIGAWTNGRESDVGPRSPACSRFDKGTPRETGVH